MKLLITRSSSSQRMIAMIAMRYNKTLAPPVQTSQVAKRGKCLSGLQIQMVKRQPPRKQKSSYQQNCGIYIYKLNLAQPFLSFWGYALTWTRHTLGWTMFKPRISAEQTKQWSKVPWLRFIAADVVENGVPSGYVKIAIEYGHLQVDIPIKNGDFPELCQFTRGYSSR